MIGQTHLYQYGPVNQNKTLVSQSVSQHNSQSISQAVSTSDSQSDSQAVSQSARQTVSHSKIVVYYLIE